MTDQSDDFNIHVAAHIPTLTVDEMGNKKWILPNGLLHREDGPAIEKANGSKLWFRHNQNHREDGPAIEYADGSKEWYIKGWRHREDGPAIDYADGTKKWYLDNKALTEAEFNEWREKKKKTEEQQRQAAVNAEAAHFHSGLTAPLSLNSGKLKLRTPPISHK